MTIGVVESPDAGVRLPDGKEDPPACCSRKEICGLVSLRGYQFSSLPDKFHGNCPHAAVICRRLGRSKSGCTLVAVVTSFVA
jgi:hypothetical protein